MKRLVDKKKYEMSKLIIEKNGENAEDIHFKNVKLGELEDIEEDLGIDLITLWKSLTGIVYYKTRCGQVCGGFGSLINTSLGVVERKYALFISDIACANGEIFQFKDYGKTWALTREELQDVSHD